MPAPHEVVASPLEVWLAPVGTAFPAIDAAPTTPWAKLGTAGSDNYDDSGVDVAHSETVSDFTPAGSTMPTKRFRTAESFQISFNLVDISPSEYAKVMNDAAVTTVNAGVGTAGQEYFDLFRGDQVNSYAVIARGVSGIDNDLTLQYEFSKAFVSVNGTVKYTKGTPASLAVTILAVRHSSSDIVRLRQQSAVAS